MRTPVRFSPTSNTGTRDPKVRLHIMASNVELGTESYLDSNSRVPGEFQDDYVHDRHGRDADLDYWKAKLAGNLPVLDLPTDRPRAAIRTYKGGARQIEFSPELTARIEAAAARANASLGVFLLAAFKAVLHRYSGQEDIIVRLEPGSLPIRTTLSAEMAFRELLNQVQDTVVSAEAHASLSFEELIELVQPERDPERAPLFQVEFAFDTMQNNMAPCDLRLSLTRGSDAISGVVEFNSEMFEAATIQRFCGHYITLVAGAVEDAAPALGRLPLVTAAEREQILVEWNATERPYPQDQCVHQLFEEQVARTPDQVAAVFEDQQLTYRELNRRANAVAARLQAAGAGPDARVGICIERSLEMLIGMLGILKAGAAYVPLDPTYPQERLAFMVEDAQLHALLTTRKLASEFDAASTKVLLIEEITPAERDENVPSGARPENLAYVIYTSGSTGKPKGVMIQHGNVVNFFAGMDEVLGTTPGTWLAVTSICFDIHVLELLWTTARGFKVVIQSDEAGMRAPTRKNKGLDGARPSERYTIPAQIARNAVTHFQCTP